MTAQLIDGAAIAKQVRTQAAAQAPPWRPKAGAPASR